VSHTHTRPLSVSQYFSTVSETPNTLIELEADAKHYRSGIRITESLIQTHENKSVIESQCACVLLHKQ